jgi:hypothetical protein
MDAAWRKALAEAMVASNSRKGERKWQISRATLLYPPSLQFLA